MTSRLIALSLFGAAALHCALATADQAEKRQRPQSPAQIVADFHRHVAAGDMSKAKELLFMPINDSRVAASIDDILRQIADENKGPSRAIDSHILSDMAVVAYGTEGRV